MITISCRGVWGWGSGNMWNLSFPLSLYKSALNSSLITHLSLEGRELKIVYIEFRSQQGTCLNFSTCVKLCYPCHHHCHHKNLASIIIRWRSCDLSCRTGLAKFTDDQRSGNLPCPQVTISKALIVSIHLQKR